MSLKLDYYSSRPYSPIPPPMPSPQLLPQPLPSPPAFPRHQRRPPTSHSSGSRSARAGSEKLSSPTSPRFPLDRTLLAVDPPCRSRIGTSRAAQTGNDDTEAYHSLSQPPNHVGTSNKSQGRENRRAQEPAREHCPSGNSGRKQSQAIETPHSGSSSASTSRSSSHHGTRRSIVASDHTQTKIRAPPVPPLPLSALDPLPLSPTTTSPRSRNHSKPVWLREPPTKSSRHSHSTVTCQSLPNPSFVSVETIQSRNSTSSNSVVSKKDDQSEKQNSLTNSSKRNRRSSRTASGIMSPILRSFKSLPNIKAPKPESGNTESRQK